MSNGSFPVRHDNNVKLGMTGGKDRLNKRAEIHARGCAFSYGGGYAVITGDPVIS